MARQAQVGATAAAMLPAALAAAVLVSAPFAGTKTAPLAHDAAWSTPASTGADAPAVTGATGQQQSPLAPTPDDHGGGHGLVVLGAAELAFLGVGAGVAVRARRRRHAAD